MNASFFSRIASETTALRTDLAQLLAARLELAKLEAEVSVTQLKRFAVLLSVFGAIALVGATLLTSTAVDLAAQRLAINRDVAMAVVGLVLVVVGAASIWAATRRFRHNFTGLHDSMAELHEDLLWLREWQGDSTADRASSDFR